MDEQWAREHVGTTPSVGGCGTSYHDERGDVQDCTSVEPCRACLRRRIAQLEAQQRSLSKIFEDLHAVVSCAAMNHWEGDLMKDAWTSIESLRIIAGHE